MRRRNNRPLIGVTGPERGERVLQCFAMLAVRLGGGRPVRLTPRRKAILPQCAGFVIAGGRDINPQLYGEAAVGLNTQYDTERDALEQETIRHAVKERLPLLGICRGMQMLNVTLGGSLYQEAGEVLEDFLPSRSLISKFIGRREVRIDPQSRLFRVLGDYEHYRVNSIHHQAVNRPGQGLKVVAREKNGLIQAMEAARSEHPFLIGVQWHPELMLHARSARNLFRALAGAG